MCPVCGTLLQLAESPQAQRERVFIERQIDAGRSEAEIKDALVAEYGNEVLALPPDSGFSLSAYLVPIVAFLVAAVALASGCCAGAAPAAAAARASRGARPDRAAGRRAARRRPRPLRPLSPPIALDDAPTPSELGRRQRADRGAQRAALACRSACSARRRRRATAVRLRGGDEQRPGSPSTGGPGEDDQLVGRAQLARPCGRSSAGRAGSPGSSPAGPATMQTSGSARPPAAPARRGRAAAGSRRGSASQRRYSCRPGAAARPSCGGQPRPREVALDEDRAPARPAPAPRRGAIAATRRLPPSPVTSTTRCAASRGSASPRRSKSRCRSDHAREPSGRRRRSPPARAAWRARRSITSARAPRSPAGPSAAAIVRFVARQSASREASTPSPSAPTTWQSR